MKSINILQLFILIRTDHIDATSLFAKTNLFLSNTDSSKSFLLPRIEDFFLTKNQNYRIEDDETSTSLDCCCFPQTVVSYSVDAVFSGPYCGECFIQFRAILFFRSSTRTVLLHTPNTICSSILVGVHFAQQSISNSLFLARSRSSQSRLQVFKSKSEVATLSNGRFTRCILEANLCH